jgi:hypothetical protein
VSDQPPYPPPNEPWGDPSQGGAPPPGTWGPPQGYPGAPPAYVENHLVWAILSTILCCLPVGAVSIWYSTQVNKRLAYGDHAGALEASSKAKTFAIASAASWAALGVLWLVFAVGVTTTRM